jgi:transcription-repair coupling factor (superfamily II helicase)
MSSTIDNAPALEIALRRVTQTPEYQQVLAELQSGSRVISISGLVTGSARALALAALQKSTGKRLAILVPATRDLENWERDLRFWYCSLTGKEHCDREVLMLPASETDPYAGLSPHPETLEKRALTLWRLTQHPQDFVLLTSRALARKMVPVEEIERAGTFLRRDLDLPPEELVEKLIATGYKREDPVSGIGEFSIRGGIVDVWPPGRDTPVRIEFFGDTIDSLREFDPETQLSTGPLNEAELAPMCEFVVHNQDFRDWAELARIRWNDSRYARSLKDRTVFADEGEAFGGWEWMFSLLRETNATIFDYLKDAILVIDEPSTIESYLGEVYQSLEERYAEIEAADDIALAPHELYLTPEELRSRIEHSRRVEIRTLGRTAATVDQELALEAESPQLQIGRSRGPRYPMFLFPLEVQATEIDWRGHSVMRYHGRLADLAARLKQGRDEGTGTLFVMPGLGTAERLVEILKEYEIDAQLTLPGESSENQMAAPIIATVGRLSSGFELPGARLAVHIETDIFDEAEPVERRATGAEGWRPKETKRRKSKAAAFLSDFRDLRPGDYVVHIDHGIARFGGLQTLDLGPRSGEFMLLYYADDAKLYVPVERLDLVQRYSSAEGHQPQLDRLGGLGWQKTKAKAKRAMRDMADELLRLYAERKLVGGFAFAGDTPWQKEFEDGFEYALTPDQETAIEDVKKDMEETVPMDRLLCGDVGYGKTEVAMRAAFKAVMEGKQAAVLTPTTVLAYQHYDTFRSRFAPFPVKVELLSRFRSAKEQKEVVKRVESGEVDVIIGTHRMLSKDVRFKDLGLVVVDEEQRFGVAHKERLKQLKKRVDVLTLSATPIPRTLNMSLSGLRDMSLIETPPRDRLAIQTQVVQFSDSVIKSAIELELARGGQVFFIHNRVETIETVAALVKRLVPQARLAVGHGQMNEKDMEKVMLDFIDYKYDVLVATTIIENGIDIPRANTIIINRADGYGLSQLYQLRGRVGRSNRRAYAYLLIPSEQELTPIARRRLAAIREFSDLGAGFRIAALDLELRGAGNLLGGEQSGHMDALGFDLYTQMLERTVAELRGEAVEDETSVSLNLGVDVAIPEEYIGDMGQRLRTYKRVSSARDEHTLTSIRAEIQDRYGRLPLSVERLFDYARLRRMAEDVGVVSIDRTPDGIAIKFSEKARISPERLAAFIGERERASFTPSGVLRLVLTEDELDEALSVARQSLLQLWVSD